MKDPLVQCHSIEDFLVAARAEKFLILARQHRIPLRLEDFDVRESCQSFFAFLKVPPRLPVLPGHELSRLAAFEQETAGTIAEADRVAPDQGAERKEAPDPLRDQAL